MQIFKLLHNFLAVTFSILFCPEAIWPAPPWCSHYLSARPFCLPWPLLYFQFLHLQIFHVYLLSFTLVFLRLGMLYFEFFSSFFFNFWHFSILYCCIFAIFDLPISLVFIFFFTIVILLCFWFVVLLFWFCVLALVFGSHELSLSCGIALLYLEKYWCKAEKVSLRLGRVSWSVGQSDGKWF